MKKAEELTSVEQPRIPKKLQLQTEYPTNDSLSPNKSKRAMVDQSAISQKLRKLKPTSDLKKDFFA
eukprot:263593-Ditylum_brightwellii.AAC.1